MGRLRQTTEEIQNLLDKVEQGEISATSDWNANLGEKGYIQNRPFRIIDTASGDEYKFDTPLKEGDFTLIVQKNEYGDIVSAKWEKILAYASASIMGVFANGYYEPTFGASYKGAIRPLGPLYRQSYVYKESDDRRYIIYIENIIDDHGDYYEEYSKLIVENDSGFGTDFPIADVYVLTSEDYPVRIDAIDENYLPDTIARTNDVDELREETTSLWENLDHGTFPNLVAGDLAGRGESVPASFGFRASGGKSIKDGRAYIKRIKGNSVVWNQKLRNSRIENADYWYSQRSNAEFNGQGVHIVATSEFSNLCQNARLILGHKYLLYASVKGNNGYRLNLNLCGQDAQGVYLSDNYAPHYYFVQFQFNEYQSDMVQLYVIENDADWYVKDCRLIDLTQMFEAGNEPTTIEEFNARKPIVEDEYAYNEGQVIHCNTESIKSIGDNAWDEQWELGIISNGENYELEGYIRSKNYIPIIGGEDYHYANRDNNVSDYLQMFFYDEHKVLIDSYSCSIGTFPTPINARYMRFYVNDTYGTTYKNDIMISLVHSGWKQDTDAGYQPYWEDTLPLPIIRKYFPDGMKKWDKIIKKDGKWYAVNAATTARIGDLTCSRFSEGIFSLGNLPKIAAVDSRGFSKNVISANFIPSLGAYGNLMETNSVCIVDGLLWLSGENLVQYETAEDLLTSLADVVVYYELAEPIVTELDAEDQNFRDYYNVADFGTEQSQSLVPSAPFSADIIYQFNAVDMIREHEAEINELQSIIATMQAQLASLTHNT